ncbi:MAG: hypothetical protein JST26_16985 [Bacteroidetes bacterium]|nr:hypothetical protein [Bacteroidota bacterium]
MLVKELPGKKITRIYSVLELEPGGLDRAECFIELENNIVIDIPYDLDDDLWIKELPVSGDGFEEHETSVFSDQRITDIISYYDGSTDKVLLLLENGVLISEQQIAPNGTALAGLTVFNNVAEMEDRYGSNYVTLNSNTPRSES